MIVMYISQVVAQEHATTEYIGYIILTIYVQVSSLHQSYSREKGLRFDFLHVHVLEKEGERSQKLLENMLPSTQHAELLIKGELILDELKDVTLLYSDMKGFTQLSAKMHPQELCKLLNLMYSQFDKHLDHFGLYKIDTIGDAFVVMGGLDGYPKSKNHAMACIQFAFHMLADTARIREICNVDVQMRIGIHTGSVMGSVVSLNKPRYLVWGPSTLIANAMESQGIPDEEREGNPKIQKYTRSAHMISCSDMTPFFHDTWSVQKDSILSEHAKALKHQSRGGALQVLSGIAKRIANTPGKLMKNQDTSLQPSYSHSYSGHHHMEKESPYGGDDLPYEKPDKRTSWLKDLKRPSFMGMGNTNNSIGNTPFKYNHNNNNYENNANDKRDSESESDHSNGVVATARPRTGGGIGIRSFLAKKKSANDVLKTPSQYCLNDFIINNNFNNTSNRSIIESTIIEENIINNRNNNSNSITSSSTEKKRKINQIDKNSNSDNEENKDELPLKQLQGQLQVQPLHHQLQPQYSQEISQRKRTSMDANGIIPGDNLNYTSTIVVNQAPDDALTQTLQTHTSTIELYEEKDEISGGRVAVISGMLKSHFGTTTSRSASGSIEGSKSPSVKASSSIEDNTMNVINQAKNNSSSSTTTTTSLFYRGNSPRTRMSIGSVVPIDSSGVLSVEEYDDDKTYGLAGIEKCSSKLINKEIFELLVSNNISFQTFVSKHKKAWNKIRLNNNEKSQK
eukprot:gene7530-15421_t